MKILSVSINENYPPTKEVLLSLCKLVNPSLSDKQIIKEIEKNGLYKPIKQSKVSKKTD